MSLNDAIIATIPFEERRHGRILTDTEADILDRLDARKATRQVYSQVQGRG